MPQKQQRGTTEHRIYIPLVSMISVQPVKDCNIVKQEAFQVIQSPKFTTICSPKKIKREVAFIVDR